MAIVKSISYDMRGAEIIDLKRQLNSHSPTRLPRLNLKNDWFGPITQSRVLEFQHYEGLGKDGIVGKNTFRKLGRRPKKAMAPTGRCIVVNLIDNNLLVYGNGKKVMTISPIRGGTPTHPTRRGVFVMTSRRLRNHTSSIYPIPAGNMDYSLFFDGGRAIHQGPPLEASHGCIHVGPPQAEQLFNWAAKTNILVIVAKLTR